MKLFGNTSVFHEREVQWFPFPLSPHTQFGSVAPRISGEVDVLFILNSLYYMYFFLPVKEGMLQLHKLAAFRPKNDYELIMKSFKLFKGWITNDSQDFSHVRSQNEFKMCHCCFIIRKTWNQTWTLSADVSVIIISDRYWDDTSKVLTEAQKLFASSTHIMVSTHKVGDKFFPEPSQKTELLSLSGPK